jgi:DNA-binding NarL/FixJ family response regulator
MLEPTRVLIADDDASFREVLAMLISDIPGVELVGVARNGQELVELAGVLHPELVLTDVNMPLMDGIAATKLLKSTPKPSMVAVCSGDGGVQMRAIALAAGADAFIPKCDTFARVTSLLTQRRPDLDRPGRSDRPPVPQVAGA